MKKIKKLLVIMALAATSYTLIAEQQEQLRLCTKASEILEELDENLIQLQLQILEMEDIDKELDTDFEREAFGAENLKVVLETLKQTEEKTKKQIESIESTSKKYSCPTKPSLLERLTKKG